MDASDQIKPCRKTLEGAVHIWGPDADRRPKLLIDLAAEGSFGCLFTRSQSSAANVFAMPKTLAAVQPALAKLEIMVGDVVIRTEVEVDHLAGGDLTW